jgi:hypothetical protein
MSHYLSLLTTNEEDYREGLGPSSTVPVFAKISADKQYAPPVSGPGGHHRQPLASS